MESGVAPTAAAGYAIKRGGTWQVGGGGASREAAFAAPDPSDPGAPIFDLASLTKSMTAIAVARSDLPHFSVDAPLGEALAEARGTASEGVPLELLLAHRAGLEANLPLFEPLLQGGHVDVAAALHAAASARRSECAGSSPPEGFAPLYSDLGYVLAGTALARAAQMVDAGAVIEARVVRPLGLDGALGTARTLAARGIGFADRVVPTEHATFRGGIVAGSVHDENAWALTGYGGSGHAGMFGTLAAVLAFGAAVFDALFAQSGPFARPPAGAAERMNGGARGLGWLVRPRPGGSLLCGFDGKSATGSSAGTFAGPRTFGHLGFTGTSYWVDPDAAIVVALLTNRVHPTRDNVAIRAARPVAHDALFAAARSAV